MQRIIQTLKKKIYKYLYYHKTCKYIDVLQELVEGCNESYHSGIRRAPITINKENELQVCSEQYLPKKSDKIQRSSSNFHQVTWLELVEQEVHLPEALDKHTQKNYSK